MLARLKFEGEMFLTSSDMNTTLNVMYMYVCKHCRDCFFWVSIYIVYKVEFGGAVACSR